MILSYLDQRVEDGGVEIPVKDEEINAETMRPGKLLLDGASIVVLPAGERFAALVWTVDQSIEMEFGEWASPAVEIIRAEAGARLGRRGTWCCNHARDVERHGL